MLLGTFLLASAACGRAAPPADARSAEHVSQETTFRDSASASVRWVDPEQRTIVLEGQDGDLLSVEAGDGVDLARFQPGARAELQYEELIALTRPGAEPAAMIDLQRRVRQLPAGIQLGRSITTTAEIVVVARDGSRVTLRGPHDAVSTLDVTAPANQRRVKRLAPGDTVAVTYTETLAVSVAHE